MGDWWDGWALAVIIGCMLFWLQGRRTHVSRTEHRREGLDFGGNQAPRRIAQRPRSRHGAEDSREEIGRSRVREIWQEDGSPRPVRQGTSRFSSFIEDPSPDNQPTFDDAPMMHHYSPDEQRDGRCCVVCGSLPGGVWHYKAVK